MTREEALAVLKTNYRCMTEEKNCPRTCEGCGLAMQPGELEEATRVAIKTLEPKTGHWIYDNYNWRCSECNETPKTLGYVGTADFMTEHFKFCNHCGARMIESQQSEDLGDYPDTIHNQFDNMTGSMNL